MKRISLLLGWLVLALAIPLLGIGILSMWVANVIARLILRHCATLDQREREKLASLKSAGAEASAWAEVLAKLMPDARAKSKIDNQEN